MANNKTQLTDACFDLGLRYKVNNHFNAQLKYRYEKQQTDAANLHTKDTYFARNLINLFTAMNGAQITYPIPLGGILDRSAATLNAWDLRGQAEYAKTWNRQQLALLAGSEVRQSLTTAAANRLYGYDEDILSTTAINAVDFMPTFQNVRYYDKIPDPVFLSMHLDRYISVFANGSYTYDDKYIISANARKDASNLFGVNTNQKWVPLWSTGFSWQLNREKFYKVKWLPYCRFRITYGFSGNVDNSLSALPTLLYSAYPGYLNNLIYADANNPPNPNLRWEKTSIINIGIDFSGKNDRVAGSLDYFHKKGNDLIGQTPVDPTTGVRDPMGAFTYKGNVANMKCSGLELDVNTKILEGRFSWDSHFIFNYVSDKVTKYNYNSTTAARYVGDGTLINPLVGKPVYAILSYKWAGLDPTTGNPRGFDDKNQPSTDYAALISVAPEKLEYNGPALPVMFGSLSNSFNWNQWTLSVIISYKLDYCFRKTSVNYNDLFSQWRGHQDYKKRWQQPGDEANTNVPSLVYPNNSNRDIFYAGSSALVEKGDHIRLQDVSLAYGFSAKQLQKLPVKNLQLYLYVNNLGIIWKANKAGLDPDYFSGGYPLPRTFSIGIKTNL
jgi:hypothetical protein